MKRFLFPSDGFVASGGVDDYFSFYVPPEIACRSESILLHNFMKFCSLNGCDVKPADYLLLSSFLERYFANVVL